MCLRQYPERTTWEVVLPWSGSAGTLNMMTLIADAFHFLQFAYQMQYSQCWRLYRSCIGDLVKLTFSPTSCRTVMITPKFPRLYQESAFGDAVGVVRLTLVSCIDTFFQFPLDGRCIVCEGLQVVCCRLTHLGLGRHRF